MGDGINWEQILGTSGTAGIVVWAILWFLRPLVIRWFDEQLLVSQQYRLFQTETIRTSTAHLEVSKVQNSRLDSIEKELNQLSDRIAALQHRPAERGLA